MAQKGCCCQITSYLLQCCLAIQGLRIQITMHPLHPRHGFANTISWASLSNYDMLTVLFRMVNSEEMVPLMLNHDDGVSKLAQLPIVTGCWFDCLQNCLKSIKIQFELLGLDSPRFAAPICYWKIVWSLEYCKLMIKI